MKDIMKLITLCKGHTVYLQTHNFPDPDAIASAFGLQRLMGEFGIKATICYAGKIDKLSAVKMLDAFGIEMYPYDALKEKMKETDDIICVDSQKNAGNIMDFVGDEVACIDHHPIFVETEYQYQDIRMTGACATIIAEYFKRCQLTPDRDTATALLYGLKMDTLQFSRGVTALDIEMFGFLHPLSDHEKLNRLERNNMEFTDLRAYGEAIESIALFDCVGFSYISFSCPDALIGILSDFILSLEEVEVAVVASVREDGIKLSVRSERDEVHAGKLIREALQDVGDGGGHAAMAGGLIRRDDVALLGAFPEEKIQELFLAALERQKKGGERS
ncbi:MAG: DHHA1 domain-containing protein [Bacillota bacterium]|nr:DHHA1 domain-containing protein [Bacillota bacterium]